MSTFLRSALKSVSEQPSAIEDVLETGLQAIDPEFVPHALQISERPVGTAERDGQILGELRAVHEDTRPNAVEYLDGESATIGIRFSIRGDFADHLRGVLVPDGAHNMVLRACPRDRQKIAAPAAAKLEADGENNAAPSQRVRCWDDVAGFAVARN